MDDVFRPFPFCRGLRLDTKGLADALGVSIDEVARWVRSGCPYKRTGSVRSPRLFDTAQVIRWCILREIDKAYGREAAKAVRADMIRELYRLKLADLGVAVPDPD